MLFHNCECPEEGTRNVVAECLGKLTLIDPATLLGNLQQHLSDESPLTRSTVVTAVKFTISDQVVAASPLMGVLFYSCPTPAWLLLSLSLCPDVTILIVWV